jgi:hypothetical protein
MAISRYKKSNVIRNNDADYKKAFSSRFGSGGILQNGAATFRIPTEDELSGINYFNEVWGLGKRLYKLSHQHYGDSQYWWVIALFNGISIESEISFGDVIKIPVPLDIVLNLYGF